MWVRLAYAVGSMGLCVAGGDLCVKIGAWRIDTENG
jgi:hypothetical protein